MPTTYNTTLDKQSHLPQNAVEACNIIRNNLDGLEMLFKQELALSPITFDVFDELAQDINCVGIFSEKLDSYYFGDMGDVLEWDCVFSLMESDEYVAGVSKIKLDVSLRILLDQGFEELPTAVKSVTFDFIEEKWSMQF